MSWRGRASVASEKKCYKHWIQVVLIIIRWFPSPFSWVSISKLGGRGRSILQVLRENAYFHKRREKIFWRRFWNQIRLVVFRFRWYNSGREKVCGMTGGGRGAVLPWRSYPGQSSSSDCPSQAGGYDGSHVPVPLTWVTFYLLGGTCSTVLTIPQLFQIW